MKFKSIGVIRTPFKEQPGTPIQGVYSEGAEGKIELFPEYVDGLQDVSGFDRVWLVYWMDRSAKAKLKVMPYRDTQERGVFATRAPSRPNPIGLSCVRVTGVSGNVISIRDVDMLDGTPLLDIKPYMPEFDSYPESKAGWFDEKRDARTQADGRFSGRVDT